ncbi:GH-E family nuclease [Haemophilus influenzae]|uniref:Toxin YqcG C-terminal domain-containing protein n=1 Tax=Haemophilus influenzae TaxID=727 RepID=A0A2S9RSS4_HAEIF|nr:hypothetical protein BV021_01304 [Haemophilus influenzae]PRI89148.1 hypothetical protein BV020_01619 [Haemophilus influenzae]PRJ67577.1 hypothetical protein BV102_00372 [Haemophilus influenzae]PRJ86684.1 hypothetical protein BV154_01762 [Haemophilus influenzae]
MHLADSVIDSETSVDDNYPKTKYSGWEHRRLEEAAKQLGLTRQEFNDYVNSRPNIFRLENRSENRSHRNEMPGKDDIERIVRDMKNFERGK